MKLISFVIPCYNSEKTVKTVIDGIRETVMQKKEEYDYEVVVVNDGSPDDVIRVLKSIAVSDEKVKVIDLAKNCGKHTAVLVGYKFAEGDYIVSIDDDGQCPIEYLWDLIAPLEEGHDMSMAKYEQKKEASYKKLGSILNHHVSKILLGKPKELRFTNFIARQKYICKAMAEYKNIFPYLEGLSLRITHDVVLVPMQENARLHGKSGYTLKKSIALDYRSNDSGFRLCVRRYYHYQKAD